MSSPLTDNLDKWITELKTDPDSTFILNGIRYGFDITDKGQNIKPAEAANSKKAEIQYRDAVEKQIRKEIELGRYVTVDKKPKIVSPISCVPKEDGSVRLIHDCSQPAGHAINDYSEKGEKLSFVSVDSAVNLVRKGWYMAKVDLRSAYRHCPISEKSRNLAGLKWRFEGEKDYTYLVDTRLMFGASLSVSTFHRITQSVVRMLKRRGINAIICYIDDFFLTAESESECKQAMDMLISVLTDLGFSISWDKCVSPCTKLTFLGVNLDTGKSVISIPSEKLKSTITTLEMWHNKKNRASKRDFQQLIGYLNWIAAVIHAVRPTLRNLIDRMVSLRASHHRMRISSSLKRTLQVIRDLCITFNGTSLFLRKAQPEATYIVSDSSTTGGGAAVVRESNVLDWTYTNWNCDYPVFAKAHINIQELAMVYIAVKRWAPSFRNCKVNVYTDNCVTLNAVNRGAIRNKLGSDILCDLLIICSMYNIKLCANWIPSKSNKLADSISRMHVLPYATFVFHRCRFTDLSYHVSQSSYKYLLQQWYSKRPYWIEKCNVTD